MNETQYWKYHEAVRGDVVKASYCYYTSKEIHAFANESRDNFNLLNTHATFWNTTLHGLQIASLMALSRLFDQGPNAHTMERFLGYTVAHPEFFSREAFDRRRMKDVPDGVRPDWLDNYVANIWVPTKDDLCDLARRLRPHRQKWIRDYSDIRDQVLAHTIIIDQSGIAALFSRTLVTDIEEILQGLRNILEIVEQLWINGRHPNQHNPNTRFIEDVVRETRELLESFRR
jgi:AbiU2